MHKEHSPITRMIKHQLVIVNPLGRGCSKGLFTFAFSSYSPLNFNNSSEKIKKKKKTRSSVSNQSFYNLLIKPKSSKAKGGKCFELANQICLFVDPTLQQFYLPNSSGAISLYLVSKFTHLLFNSSPTSHLQLHPPLPLLKFFKHI